MKKGHESSYVLSYLTIRKVVGFLGLLIPFLMFFGGLIFGQKGLQDTISNYYYTNMQDLLVGILCAVSLFLINYKGYETIDNVATNVAGVGSLGVAFFPIKLGSEIQYIGIFRINADVSFALHLASAAVFFAAIAFICLFLFTKTKHKKMSDAKIRRNAVYITCGIVIAVALLLIVFCNVFPDWIPSSLHPLFFLESIALVAFGIAWLVKGEAMKRFWKRK